MGFRFRQNINLGGGFRVTLSKSGIGYSWGAGGYRITRTADGRTRRTIFIPGTGLSYVEEHRSGRGGAERQSASSQQHDPYADYTNIQRVVSSGADTLRSPVYSELFKHIKFTKHLRTALIALVIPSLACPPLGIVWLILAVLLVKERCFIIYEFDESEQQKWDDISKAWMAVAGSESLHEVTLTARSHDSRRSAGIEDAVDTVKISSGNKLPWYLKTNITPIIFNLKDQQIAIMPDRLLIFGKKQFGALAYNEIKIDISAFGFLEGGESVPSDSEVVKMVWAYSNNDGSPDRRYANNRQYPILKYGKIDISSPDGLNIQILCSNESASDALNEVINGAAQEEHNGHEA